MRQRDAATRIWFARDEATTFEGSSVDANEQSFGHLFFTKDCPADKRVSLEEGARVMLLVNVDLEAKGEERAGRGDLACGQEPLCAVCHDVELLCIGANTESQYMRYASAGRAGRGRGPFSLT